MEYKVLELYSGIGGMHSAWKLTEIPGSVVAACDVNNVANDVYKLNYPKTRLLNRNIQSLKPEEIDKLGANIILMSPPCQPFTRNGKYLDSDDPRTNSFQYLLSILESIPKIQYILVENVKGFEASEVRNEFIKQLQNCNFVYQEFLISPTSVGIPNSRLRYYCIAQRKNCTWSFKSDGIMRKLPQVFEAPPTLEEFIENNVTEEYLIPDKLLKRGNIFDICHRHSSRSCCFTKAYSHYAEGTGSIYTDADADTVKQAYESANKYEVGGPEFIEELKPLKLRFFTPKEVALLMAFPENYEFPKHITRKQAYRLLGNSINIKVVSELIKLMLS